MIEMQSSKISSIFFKEKFCFPFCNLLWSVNQANWNLGTSIFIVFNFLYLHIFICN